MFVSYERVTKRNLSLSELFSLRCDVCRMSVNVERPTHYLCGSGNEQSPLNKAFLSWPDDEVKFEASRSLLRKCYCVLVKKELRRRDGTSLQVNLMKPLHQLLFFY